MRYFLSTLSRLYRGNFVFHDETVIGLESRRQTPLHPVRPDQASIGDLEETTLPLPDWSLLPPYESMYDRRSSRLASHLSKTEPGRRGCSTWPLYQQETCNSSTYQIHLIGRVRKVSYVRCH